MSAAGKASASEVAAGVCHEGAKAGLAIEERRAEAAPAIEAMGVDTIGQV